MDTNHVTNVNTCTSPESVYPQIPQTPVLELAPYRKTAQYTSFFRAPSGHIIIVTSTFCPETTLLSIRVENEDGYLDACSVSFRGVNHEEDYAEFYEQYMDSPALFRICEDFDELCTWYEEDEC